MATSSALFSAAFFSFGVIIGGILLIYQENGRNSLGVKIDFFCGRGQLLEAYSGTIIYILLYDNIFASLNSDRARLKAMHKQKIRGKRKGL